MVMVDLDEADHRLGVEFAGPPTTTDWEALYSGAVV